MNSVYSSYNCACVQVFLAALTILSKYSVKLSGGDNLSDSARHCVDDI